MKPVGVSVRQEVSQRKIATHRPRTAPNKKDNVGTERKESPDRERPESAAQWRKSGPTIDVAKSLWYNPSLNKDFVLASIYLQDGVLVPESPAKTIPGENDTASRPKGKPSLSELCHDIVSQNPGLVLTDSLTATANDVLNPEGSILSDKESTGQRSDRNSRPSTARASVKFIDLGSALENDNTPFTSPKASNNPLHQASGELSIGTAEKELSKHDSAGISPMNITEEEKTRMGASAQRFFFDMWLAEHGTQVGADGEYHPPDALNVELLAKLDHSLRQAAFEYEQKQDELSVTSQQGNDSSAQQIAYIRSITHSAIDVFDRLIQEIGDKFPLLKTLKRALMPAIFANHLTAGILHDHDDASVTHDYEQPEQHTQQEEEAGESGVTGVSRQNERRDGPNRRRSSLVVEEWFTSEGSLRYLSSVHEGLSKDFARINHDLHECRQLLAVQEGKYQAMVHTQARTCEELRDSNSDRLKYISDCSMLREELDIVEKKFSVSEEARIKAENLNVDLNRKLNDMTAKNEVFETKAFDQAAVIERFKKELNDLKKERRDVKRDLYDVQDKYKHLRHTLIHDRKEVLESFDDIKDFARKMCENFKLMEIDRENEDNKPTEDEAPAVINSENGENNDDAKDGEITNAEESTEEKIAAAAEEAEVKEAEAVTVASPSGPRPKTAEELKEEEDDLLEMEFTDRAWQTGTYLQHTHTLLSEEIKRLQQVEETLHHDINKMKVEKNKMIAAHDDKVDKLHAQYKKQLHDEEKSAEYIQNNLRLQLQQKEDDIKQLKDNLKKNDEKLQMIQQHARQIEIELTNSCTQVREQNDTLNMLKEDHRAEQKISRRNARIESLETTLQLCQVQLQSTEEKLAVASKKLEAEESAAAELASTWEKRYQEDMAANEKKCQAKIDAKMEEIHHLSDKYGMVIEDMLNINRNRAIQRKKMLDIQHQLRQHRTALQTKEAEVAELNDYIAQLEEMYAAAQATIEDFVAQDALAVSAGGAARRTSTVIMPTADAENGTPADNNDNNGAEGEQSLQLPTSLIPPPIRTTVDDTAAAAAGNTSKVTAATRMQLMKGMTPINRALAGPLRVASGAAPAKRSSMSALLSAPRKEFVTKTVQTDEMGDMFMMIASKYKSVEISAKNSPEAWEYLAIRMHLEHKKILSIAEFYRKEKKVIESQLEKLRLETQEVIAKIPALINNHVQQMAGLRMMEMVKEEAERRMRESTDQQMKEHASQQPSKAPTPTHNHHNSPPKPAAAMPLLTTSESSFNIAASESQDVQDSSQNTNPLLPTILLSPLKIESTDLSLPSPSLSGRSSTTSPQKLQSVDISLLYKLTKKIKKTLDWKKSVLPSNTFFGSNRRNEYDVIDEEDEDEFDESHIASAYNTKPKRISDVLIEPVHAAKAMRRTQLRQFSNAQFYNRGTQTWDQEETSISNRFHNRLLDKGSEYSAEKVKVFFPHRAKVDEDYTKRLLAMSVTQLSQPFIGYIRMNEKQYAREVGLMKVALRECRGMYERMLARIQEEKAKLHGDDDPTKIAPLQDIEGSLKEYHWIFDPKAFIGRIVVGENQDGNFLSHEDVTENDIFDDEGSPGKETILNNKSKKKKGKIAPKPKSFLSFSPLPGHMDPIDIATQARMIVSYRQALEKEKAFIEAGNVHTEDGTDRTMIIHAIEDLIVDLHTRMEIHGGWQALLYRVDGSVDYDMDFSAFSQDEQRDILLEQKKLLRIQLQTQQERANKKLDALEWELKRFKRQEKRRAQRRGGETPGSHNDGFDNHDDEADIGVQTMNNWQWLQPVTYQSVQKTLGEVVDVLRYVSSSLHTFPAVSAAIPMEPSIDAMMPHQFHPAIAAAASAAGGDMALVSAAPQRMTPQLPPLHHNQSSARITSQPNNRPKTAAMLNNQSKKIPAQPSFLTDYSLVKSEQEDAKDHADAEFVSFIQRKPLLQTPMSSLSPGVTQMKKTISGSNQPVSNKKRPWSSSQWKKVQEGTKQQFPQLQPLLLSSSTSMLSTASYSPSSSLQHLQMPMQQPLHSSSQEIMYVNNSNSGMDRMSILGPSTTPQMIVPTNGQIHQPSFLEQGSSTVEIANNGSNMSHDLMVEGHEKRMIVRKDCLTESSIVIYEQLMEHKRQEEFRRQLQRAEELRRSQEMATLALVSDELRAIYHPGDQIRFVSRKVSDNVYNSDTNKANDSSNHGTSSAAAVGTNTSDESSFARAKHGMSPGLLIDHFSQDPWQLKYQIQTVHTLCAQLFQQIATHNANQTSSKQHQNNNNNTTGKNSRGGEQSPAMQFTDSIATTEKSQSGRFSMSEQGSEHESFAIGESALEDHMGSVTLPPSSSDLPQQKHQSPAAAARGHENQASVEALSAEAAKRVHFSHVKMDAAIMDKDHSMKLVAAAAAADQGTDPMPSSTNQLDSSTGLESKFEMRTKTYEDILTNAFSDSNAPVNYHQQHLRPHQNISNQQYENNHAHHHNAANNSTNPALVAYIRSIQQKRAKTNGETPPVPFTTDLIHHAIQLYDTYGRHTQALRQCEERLRQLHQSHGHLSDLKTFIVATGLHQPWLYEQNHHHNQGNHNEPVLSMNGFGNIEDARSHYANKLLYQRLAEHFQLPSVVSAQQESNKVSHVHLEQDEDPAEEGSNIPPVLATKKRPVTATRRTSATANTMSSATNHTSPSSLLLEGNDNNNPVVAAYVQKVTTPILLPNGRRTSTRSSFSHSTFAIQALANTTLDNHQSQQGVTKRRATSITNMSPTTEVEEQEVDTTLLSVEEREAIASTTNMIDAEMNSQEQQTVLEEHDPGIQNIVIEDQEMPPISTSANRSTSPTNIHNPADKTTSTTSTSSTKQQLSPTAQRATLAVMPSQQRKTASQKSMLVSPAATTTSKTVSSSALLNTNTNTNTDTSDGDNNNSSSNNNKSSSRLRRSLTLARGASSKVALPSPGKAGTEGTISPKKKAVDEKKLSTGNPSKGKATKMSAANRSESPLPMLQAEQTEKFSNEMFRDLISPRPPGGLGEDESLLLIPDEIIGEFSDILEDDEYESNNNNVNNGNVTKTVADMQEEVLPVPALGIAETFDSEVTMINTNTDLTNIVDNVHVDQTNTDSIDINND